MAVLEDCSLIGSGFKINIFSINNANLINGVRLGSKGLHLPAEDGEVEVETVVAEDWGHNTLRLLKLPLMTCTINLELPNRIGV